MSKKAQINHHLIERTSNCNEHTFNGGIIAIDEDGHYKNVVEDLSKCKLLNVYRNSKTSGGPCKISAKYINIFGKLDESLPFFDIFDEGNREDPRCFVYHNQLYISYSLVYYDDESNIENVNVLYTLIHRNNDNTYAVDAKTCDMCINYKNNSHPSTAWEKNWCFFEYDNELHFIYNIIPLEIAKDCQTVKQTDWKNNYVSFYEMKEKIAPLFIPKLVSNYRWVNIYKEWKYSFDIRGGAPPVLLDNIYYVFAHTREMPQIHYRIMVITFDKEFNLKGYTDPIDLYENDPHKFNIIFPVGAVFDKSTQTWYISCGLSDKEQILVTIKHVFLLEKLKSAT